MSASSSSGGSSSAASTGTACSATSASVSASSSGGEKDDALERLRENLIGSASSFVSPFGRRIVVYADSVASGRPLACIESFIEARVLPFYANTHSQLAACSSKMNKLVHDARAAVHDSLNCGPDDVVTFHGSGSTAAVQRMIGILGLSKSVGTKSPSGKRRPVVFISMFEHHSNILPWRESIAEVVLLPSCPRTGTFVLGELVAALKKYKSRAVKIGSFCAASNVTGQRLDVRAITRVLHEHGALAMFDFAAAAPYVQIDMNPDGGDPLSAPDAVFVSPHKFPGGPGAPGLLVAKRKLFSSTQSAAPGGGTVLFVSKDGQMYLHDPEAREEGGTPNITGIIRCGLAFKIRDSIGTARIHELEAALLERAFERLGKNKRVQVLGSLYAERLAFFSFVVESPIRGLYLHPAFVVTLLNDLFGIQARSGCNCAGPYATEILGISPEYNALLTAILTKAGERGGVVKPGWTRLSFNYFITDAEAGFLLDAIEFIAAHGYKMLTLYEFNVEEIVYKFLGAEGLPRVAAQESSSASGSSSESDALELTAFNLKWTGRPAAHQHVADAAYFERTVAAANELRRWLEKNKPEPRAAMPEAVVPGIKSADWLRACYWLSPHEAYAYMTGKKSLDRAALVMLRPRVFDKDR